MTELPALRAKPRSGFRFRVGVAISDVAVRASLAVAIHAAGAVALALQSLLARSYVAEYLWQLTLAAERSMDQPRRRNVQATAEALAVTRRALEKALATSASPQPKELSDWLTLLLITHTARGLGRLSRDIAAGYDIGRHKWSRLRTQRLKSYPAFPVLPAYAQFDLALTVFGLRCGIPQGRLAGALRMAV